MIWVLKIYNALLRRFKGALRGFKRMDKITNDRGNIEALNRLLTDVMNAQEKALRQMRRAIIITVVCFSAIVCTGIIGFFWYESQYDEISTTTTTTTLSADGENSKVNHAGRDMYNDEAQHTEGIN